jgi:hypothetical protein
VAKTHTRLLQLCVRGVRERVIERNGIDVWTSSGRVFPETTRTVEAVDELSVPCYCAAQSHPVMEPRCPLEP